MAEEMAPFEVTGHQKCLSGCSSQLSDSPAGCPGSYLRPCSRHGMIWMKKLPACVALTGAPCLRTIVFSDNCLELLTSGSASQDTEPVRLDWISRSLAFLFALRS